MSLLGYQDIERETCLLLMEQWRSEADLYIVAHDGGVWHMHEDKVRHCDLDQKDASTAAGLRCGDWQ